MRRRRPKVFLKGRTARARRQLAAVFLLIFAPAVSRAARADCVPFAEPPAISNSADGASAATTADLDGDGDLDILVAAYNGDEYDWYENDGSGGGWTVHTIALALNAPRSIATGDLDGDGDLDAIVVSSEESRLSWRANDGDGGGWTHHTISTVTLTHSSVSAADIDGDGDPDVLSIAFSGPTSGAWFENDGGGEGWTLHSISTLLTNPAFALAAADVDGDGDLDALSADFARVAWYVNDGTPLEGIWAAHTIMPSFNATSVAATDIDGDGDLDVLSTRFGGNLVVWSENDGTPLDDLWPQHTVSTLALGAETAATADLDGDGDLDVLSASGIDDKIAWYENDGDGAGWTLHTLSTLADGARGVLAGDFDGDGDLDAVSTSTYDDTVAWYRNDRLHGAPLFLPAVDLTGALDAPRQLEAGDLDGDGDLDLVSASQLDDTIAWRENAGGLLLPRTISTSALGALSVAIGDVDSDGDLDVLSASRDDDAIAWYRNEGLGDDVLLWTKITISALANVARQVVAADLDGDGDLDAVSASRDDDLVAWYENNGKGTSWTLHEIATTANGAFSVAVVDLDGDGDLDVVSASIYDDEITWYRSDGDPTDGGWTELLISGDYLNPRFVVAGDFDRDGDTDVVSASSSDGTIMLHRNFFGTGTLWQRTTVSTAATAVYSVRAVDVDGDGDLDIASANFGSDTVAWYENDGAGGGWTEHTVSIVPDQPTSVVFADFDRNGTLDAAFTSNSADSVRLTMNPGTQVFAEGHETNEGTACWSSALP